MTRRDRFFFILLGVLFVALVAVEVFAPKPIDWTPSLAAGDARPYGGEIVRALLPELVPGHAHTDVSLPPYLRLRADTTRTGQTYLFLADAFAPDPAETAALIGFVARGNTVFVAAHRLDGAFADTLGLETEARFGFSLSPLEGDTLTLRLVNPALGRPQGYRVPEVMARATLERFDTLRTTVLGLEGGTEGRGAAHFVRTTVGAGAVFVSTTPLVFTNYGLLAEDAAAYAAGALAYLPDQPIWWDAYYKPTNTRAASPLRFILADPALRAALGVLLGGALLYIVFAGKRRQRVVPVIPPKRNTTLDFTRTVGRLYLQHGNHAALADKKIMYFLEDLRTRLHVPAATPDAALVRPVAERAGVPEDEVAALFARLRAAQAQPTLSKDDLLALDDALEAFHARRKR